MVQRFDDPAVHGGEPSTMPGRDRGQQHIADLAMPDRRGSADQGVLGEVEASSRW